jgi:diguanylate cyclase (GGDEF)-like protein
MSAHLPGPMEEEAPARVAGTERLVRLQTRIILFIAGLLVLVLGSVLLVVDAVNSRNAHAAIDASLEVGKRVFDHLLEQNNRQLTQAADILSLDFAFRQAVATRDMRTAESVLANHGARIKADMVTLVSLEHAVIADTLDRSLAGQPFRFKSLIATAEREGIAAGLVASDDRLYQLVAVPVRAPEPIAWAVFGMRLEDRIGRDLQSLSRLEISFFAKAGDGDWKLLSSTLSRGLQQAELHSLAGDPGSAGRSLTIEGPGGEYQTLLVPLGKSGPHAIVAVLAQSVDEALAPYRKLGAILAALGAAALALSIIGGALIGRSITRPIRALAEMARRIEQGDFTHAAEVGGRDEIGALARSFNRMREGLSAREDQIRRLAFRDALTDLPNRTLFNDRLNVALEIARRTKSSFTVLLMDLDRFKQINDTLGHQIGDQVLQQAARRLREMLRKSDTIARLGGDEFSVVLSGTEPAEGKQIAANILRALEEPIVIGEHLLDVRASIGVASYPADGEDAETLMRHADVAMYVAKRGNFGVTQYEPVHDSLHKEQLSLLGELRRAIENAELYLVFQPKIDALTGEVTGAEALVRWQHPQRGAVPPAQFIPFAEQTGFVRLITRWVIDAAAAQSARWIAAGAPLKLAVNISAQDLLDPATPEAIVEALDRHGVPAKLFGLEVTESGVMQDPAMAIGVIKRLRALGIGIAIDDFGTGYSSLAYVKQLEVSELKIDRSFVRNIVQDAKDRAIVLSIIELSHNLELTVVAEGVEDEASVDVLRKLGCDLIQGYVYSRPLPERELGDWIAGWRPRAMRDPLKR